jgi:hypothetical protein
MPISDDTIIAVTKAAAAAAVQDYEAISRTNHYWMPEYWVTHHIASEIARLGMAVACEERIRGLAHDYGKDGRFDVAVYDLTEEGGRGCLRALIEVKGPRTSWLSFRTDLKRLVEIADRLHGSVLTGLIHATGPMSDDRLNADEKTFADSYAVIFQRSPSYLQRQNCKFETLQDVWEVWSLFNR